MTDCSFFVIAQFDVGQIGLTFPDYSNCALLNLISVCFIVAFLIFQIIS